MPLHWGLFLCIVPNNGANSILTSPQDALARLGSWGLVRDDSGPSRVYRQCMGLRNPTRKATECHLAGTPKCRCPIYFSVTSILSATQEKSGLEHWASSMDRMYGPGAAIQERNVAAQRGTATHNQAEYLLKTATKLARSTANRAGIYRTNAAGLEFVPEGIYRWALAKASKKLPACGWSAAGYARSLTGWILENVTQCYACEFSIHHPAGFAGTADGLISVSAEALEQYGGDPALAGAPLIADWKTSAKRKSPSGLTNYRLQAGAYALGLEHLTGIVPQGAFIVLARRVGPPDIAFMNRDELVLAQDQYLERCRQFYEALAA